MLFVTFMGLALIAAGVKVARVIQEKMEKKKDNNHEDCCGQYTNHILDYCWWTFSFSLGDGKNSKSYYQINL